MRARLLCVSCSSEQPIGDNITHEGRQQDRREELVRLR